MPQAGPDMNQHVRMVRRVCWTHLQTHTCRHTPADTQVDFSCCSQLPDSSDRSHMSLLKSRSSCDCAPTSRCGHIVVIRRWNGIFSQVFPSDRGEMRQHSDDLHGSHDDTRWGVSSVTYRHWKEAWWWRFQVIQVLVRRGFFNSERVFVPLMLDERWKDSRTLLVCCIHWRRPASCRCSCQPGTVNTSAFSRYCNVSVVMFCLVQFVVWRTSFFGILLIEQLKIWQETAW